MFNKIILVGNLTRNVEVRYSASNLAIGNTGIATNRKFKNQMSEEKEEVMFVDLTFFGRTAEIANQYLKKGSKVMVEGRLKLDQWTDKNGAKRSKHSITVESMQMLDSKKDREEQYGDYRKSSGPVDTYRTDTPTHSYQDKIQTTADPAKEVKLDLEDEVIPF